MNAESICEESVHDSNLKHAAYRATQSGISLPSKTIFVTREPSDSSK